MGQVADRLDHAGIALKGTLADGQGENERRQHANQQLGQAQHQGVADDLPGLGRFEEALEPVQQGLARFRQPGAARNALFQGVVFERDLDAVHGCILVHQEKQHAGDKHDVQRPVLPDCTPKTA